MPPLPPHKKEQQWAAELQKAKQKTIKKKKVPSKVRAKEINEKMDHYKDLIFQATLKGSQPDAISAMSKIIELRAEQVVMSLERFKELFGKIGDNVVSQEIENYTKDCLELAATVDAMLGINQKEDA